jgi:hypothetical protein
MVKPALGHMTSSNQIKQPYIFLSNQITICADLSDNFISSKNLGVHLKGVNKKMSLTKWGTESDVWYMQEIT